MTKKGYQKRLPAVPTPRADPPRAAAPPATAPPATAPRAAAPPMDRDPAPPAPRQPLKAESVPPRPTEVTPVAAPAPRRPAPATLVKAAAVVVTVLGLALLAFVVVGTLEERTEAPVPTTEDTAFAPRMLAADESYVETRVLADGTIVVRQWIRAAEPLARLRLALPTVPGGPAMSATGIEVVAAGNAADGPATISSRGATYTFEETTDVEVRYRLAGAVERSESAPGRALALVTTLDARYSPRVARETRVVRATAVLSLACAPSAEESPVPCGRADGDDQWRVDLLGSRVHDRVLAQLTLE